MTTDEMIKLALGEKRHPAIYGSDNFKLIWDPSGYYVLYTPTKDAFGNEYWRVTVALPPDTTAFIEELVRGKRKS